MKIDGREVTSFPRKTYTPTGNLVALFVYTDEDVSRGGIIVPEQFRGTWNTPIAKVIAVGPACKYVKEGDTVLALAETSGKMVRHTVDEIENCTMVIREENIIGVIDPSLSERNGETPKE